MAPEQAKGEPVTARSDIYSLGTVLFTLMSGKPPFSANSMEESFRNLTRVPVPKISSKVSNVPPEVEALLAAMMEKKPEKRIATAQATLFKISAIFESLKEESEAKTAHGSLPVSDNINIEDLGSSATRSSDELTEGPSSSKRGQQKVDSSATQLSSDGAKTIRQGSLSSDPLVNGVDQNKASSVSYTHLTLPTTPYV